MEEYVVRGQLRGWGSPGRWWQIKQKRPHATPRPALSPSPLTSVMGTGSLKWVATAKCIIFEMLSHKPSWPHIQLCLMLFMSLPFQLPFAVSNCLPPASEMSCQTWTGLSFVCQGGDRLGVTTSKKERKTGLKWSAQRQTTKRPLPKSFIEEGFKLLTIQISVWPDGNKVPYLPLILDFLRFPLSFPKDLQISFTVWNIVCPYMFDFSHDVEQW